MGFTGPIDDQLAIRTLNDSYCDAVFRRDAKDWGENWTVNACWKLRQPMRSQASIARALRCALATSV